MTIINNVTLPEKAMPYALTAIYGIGVSTGITICNILNISEIARPSELTHAEIISLENYIKNNVKTEGELKREVQKNVDIKRELVGRAKKTKRIIDGRK